MTRELSAKVTIDHTNGLRRITDHSYNRTRTINLRFTEQADGQGYLVQAWGSSVRRPDGEWSLDGFWGYRHLVEHSFSRTPGFDSRISIPANQVIVGLNVDKGVDHPAGAHSDIWYPESAHLLLSLADLAR